MLNVTDLFITIDPSLSQIFAWNFDSFLQYLVKSLDSINDFTKTLNPSCSPVFGLYAVSVQFPGLKFIFNFVVPLTSVVFVQNTALMLNVTFVLANTLPFESINVAKN